MGANQHGGANFWRRAAAEVDASFLDVNEYAPAPRRGPAVSTISAREEADSNLRWARVQRREKLRGPVTITETLSLGLGAAALAAYASHGIPRRDRYDTVDFNSPASDDKAAVSDARPAAPGDSGAATEARATEAPASTGSTAEAGETIGGGGFGGRRAPRGTTFIPTTILRPAGETDGLAWSKAPAGPSPFAARVTDAASAAKAGPLPDIGFGMTAAHVAAAQIIAEVDMAAVAAPYAAQHQAAAEPQQAKAPDGLAATAKAADPGSGAIHAAPRPELAAAEVKPTESQPDLAAAPPKAAQAPAGPTSHEAADHAAAGAPASTTDHAAVQDTHGLAAAEQAKASGAAAVGASLVASHGIAAARAAMVDEAHSQARAEPDHASEPAGPAKAAASFTVVAAADHDAGTSATGHSDPSAAGGGSAQAPILHDIVQAPTGIAALPDAATRVLDSLGLPKAGAADHGMAGEAAHAAPGAEHATGVAALPDAATKVLDSLGLPKAGAADHGTAGEAAHAAPGPSMPPASPRCPTRRPRCWTAWACRRPGLPITARPARRRMQRPAPSTPPASPRCPMRRPRCWTAWACPRPGQPITARPARRRMQRPAPSTPPASPRCPMRRPRCWTAWACPRPGSRSRHGRRGGACSARRRACHRRRRAARCGDQGAGQRGPAQGWGCRSRHGRRSGACGIWRRACHRRRRVARCGDQGAGQREFRRRPGLTDHGTTGEAAPAASGTEHATGVAALPDAATKVLDSVGLPKAGAADHGTAGEAAPAASVPSMPLASPRCPMRRPMCWIAWVCPRPGRLIMDGRRGGACGIWYRACHRCPALPDAATKVLDSVGLPKAADAEAPADPARAW